MKSMKELFTELGFKSESPDTTAQAFIENLIKAANETAQEPINLREFKENHEKSEGCEQLSFDLVYEKPKKLG